MQSITSAALLLLTALAFGSSESCGERNCLNHQGCCASSCYNPNSFQCYSEEGVICFQGQKLCGRTCYSSFSFKCFDNSALCLIGSLSCNNTCYNPFNFICINETVLPTVNVTGLEITQVNVTQDASLIFNSTLEECENGDCSNGNFGNTSYLIAGSWGVNSSFVLSFNTSEIPINGTILQVFLDLYLVNVTAEYANGTYLPVSALQESWTEDNITASNAPNATANQTSYLLLLCSFSPTMYSLDTPANSSFFFYLTSYNCTERYQSAEITDLFLTALASNSSVLNLKVQPPFEFGPAYFYSKEAQFPPRLRVISTIPFEVTTVDDPI